MSIRGNIPRYQLQFNSKLRRLRVIFLDVASVLGCRVYRVSGFRV